MEWHRNGTGPENRTLTEAQERAAMPAGGRLDINGLRSPLDAADPLTERHTSDWKDRAGERDHKADA